MGVVHTVLMSKKDKSEDSEDIWGCLFLVFLGLGVPSIMLIMSIVLND